MQKNTEPPVRTRNLSSELERFSCSELASLRLPGAELSERGWRKVVEREGWPFVEVQAQGGKAGVKREYTPPAPLLALIQRHLRGEEVTEEEVRRSRAARSVVLDECHRVTTTSPEGVKAVLGGFPKARLGMPGTPTEPAPVILGVPYHGAPADLDVVLFEKVLRAVDDVFDPAGAGMTIEDEGYIVRALYAHFLSRKAAITEGEIANYLRFCITNLPSRSA